MFSIRVLTQFEVEVCRTDGARTMLGNVPSPARQGWGAVPDMSGQPTGLHLRLLPLENISRTSLQNCRSLGCARDDKGEGRCFHLDSLLG